MLYKTISLQLTTKKMERLKKHFRKVLQYLESGLPLRLTMMKELADDLTKIVNHSRQWQEVLQGINDSGEFYCVHLQHPDNEILNLPWSMAVDDISGKPLGQIAQLYLTKTIPGYFKPSDRDLQAAAPPLKILIMISSPEDSPWGQYLSYEEEEFEILKAFEPLMQTGQVQIDFTEDGSLDTLERKLMANKYHILHFSGHSLFNEADKTGYLLLEDPLTLKSQKVTDRDFAETVHSNPYYQVPMVVLSSCQTAKGSMEKGYGGVSNQLLRMGVPVVVAMGMHISDKYAALFASRFYRNIAGRKMIFTAFHEALAYLEQQEYEDMVQAGISPPVPLQWTIPNLYLSRQVHQVLDWDQQPEKLDISSNRYIFEKDLLLLKHEREYMFIGRREEKAGILRSLFEKKPVLLKGQGGVGKTAMAEHLVQRLIAANPKTIPFVFNEKIKSIKEILEVLQNFLRQQGYIQVVIESIQFEKAMDRFIFLVFTIARTCNYQPVFVFDSLDSFQSAPGKELAEEFNDIKAIIGYLCNSGQFHVILICRYPVPDFGNLQRFDLNQVGLNDFLKKCLYLDVGNINTYLQEAAAGQRNQGVPRPPVLTFMQIVKLLHQTFGGNYRALEFFNQLLRENPGKIKNALDSLEAFQQDTREAVAEVKQKIGQSLLFSRLMALLQSDQQQILDLLSNFRVPVQPLALELQMGWQKQQEPVDMSPVLDHLHRLTLIEISLNRELKAFYFYVTPIVKDLLTDYRKQEKQAHFSHEKAGIYYYHRFYNIDRGLTSLAEAFYHFDQAGDKERIEEIGDRLSRVYYDYSMYHNALFYARRVYELLGKRTRSSILNRMGMIYYLYGDYDRGLEMYKRARVGYKENGDKPGEGTTLNNISQVYTARGDYETALKYLEQSLKISQEIGDKAGEGTTLNNISQVYDARGDYETALKYLEQSLKISQEIGDKAGEGTTLNNIAAAAYARGDYETALKFLEQSLKISQEIGDKTGESTTLNNMSQIYDSRGDYETALRYLEQSLKISQEIGDKFNEGITLNNISQVFKARGDYETALIYLEQSLKISHEIGDKAGEGTTLNNISQIYAARGDYETALKYLEQSLKITREIGDKSGMATTLHNMAAISLENKDTEKYLKYEMEAYRLALEINDAYTIYQVGANLGYYLYQVGKKSESLEMLKQSSTIGKAAGFPDVGVIDEMIRNAEKTAPASSTAA
ncbi:MAG: tetratricopeptide repeat protein [Candidatus Aminicenantes bacterium]|nr:MAG: tetratricopeptide repeat protein [Candidatus Aminicenantes bacterium]